AAVIAARTRIRVLLAFLAVSVGIVALLLLLGAGSHLFGFVTEQTDRGLQIEAVAATPFMWMAVAGAASVDYSFEILTFQIDAAGTEPVSALLTPLMALAAAALVVLGLLRARRGAAMHRLLPPLTLSLVVVLIVTNKVGSPQFQSWLIVPVILWIMLDRTRSGVPAVIVLALCGITCLVYPLTYDGLLRAER